MIEEIEFGKETALGVFIGLLFIILNVTLGLVIGIPTLAFSSATEKYTIRDGIAPIVEEGAFRALLPFALFTIGVPFFLNLAINVVSFPAFHYFVYGSSIKAASSLFIGAGLFALVAFLVTYYQSDYDDFQIPVAAIIGHAIINTWLGIRASGLVIVGGF